MVSYSYIEYRQRVISYLQETYRRSNKTAGWGLRLADRCPISIVNTGEALLICHYLNIYDEVLADPKARQDIHSYLVQRLSDILSCKSIRTRDLAYLLISLQLLGDSSYHSDLISCLNKLAKASGWPIGSDEPTSSLVSTYQAIYALELVGESIPDCHYIWLNEMQKPNSLCGYTAESSTSDFGASCLVLNLISKRPIATELWVKQLASSLAIEMSFIIEEIAEARFDWIGTDPMTDFKVFGYGHGLQALNNLSFELDGYATRLLKSSIRSNSLHKPAPSQFLPFTFFPTQTWLPSVLESVIAVINLQSRIDLFAYYTDMQTTSRRSSTPELDTAKYRINLEMQKLTVRQARLDELEKDLIRTQLHQQNSHFETIKHLELFISSRALRIERMLGIYFAVSCVVLLVHAFLRSSWL